MINVDLTVVATGDDHISGQPDFCRRSRTARSPEPVGAGNSVEAGQAALRVLVDGAVASVVRLLEA